MIFSACQETRWLRHIANGDMPIGHARKIVADIDDVEAITDRVTFQMHMAALSRVFADEVETRQAFSRITLRQMLLNAARPSRVEWLLNHRRFARDLPADRRVRLACGTTSNEALHRELNSEFDLVHDMHVDTLRLKLHIFTLYKCIAHHRARQGRSVRQMDQQLLMSRAARGVQLWTPQSWTDWCNEDRVIGRATLSTLHLPLARSSAARRKVVKEWNRRRPAARSSSSSVLGKHRGPFRQPTGFGRVFKRPSAAKASHSVH